MLYRTNADAIRPLHEWAATFERYWRHQLTRIKERAESMELTSERDETKKRRNEDDGNSGGN
jgi:hypothetical protein